MILEHQHFNRVKMIIENPENNSNHLQAITEIVSNYRLMFGCSKLYLKILKKQTELYKRV